MFHISCYNVNIDITKIVMYFSDMRSSDSFDDSYSFFFLILLCHRQNWIQNKVNSKKLSMIHIRQFFKYE
jgi:hypothetical protein